LFQQVSSFFILRKTTMTRNDTKSQVTPKVEATTAPEQTLWVKVSPETAVQVSGGGVILAE
jgi:hypothetical protein